MLKQCKKCGVEKPLTDFYKKFGRENYVLASVTSDCRSCTIIKHTKYYQENPHKRKMVDLKQSFGITLDQYNQLFSNQNGCCAICQRHQTVQKRQLAVDHDHKTGLVRGLLCDCCNTAIGKLREDPELFKNALVYLNKSRDDEAKILCLPRRGRRGGKTALQALEPG